MGYCHHHLSDDGDEMMSLFFVFGMQMSVF